MFGNYCIFLNICYSDCQTGYCLIIIAYLNKLIICLFLDLFNYYKMNY